MAVNLSPVGGAAAQFFDNNGNPLTGGKIYTYAAGTTTPATTYTSSNGATAHTNPIVLDASGRVPGGEIWLTINTTYKFVLRTSADVLIGTYDNISSAFNTDASLVTYTPAGTGAVTTTVQAKLRETVSVKDFGAVGNGVTNDTAAIQAAMTASEAVYFPAGTYLITSALVLKTGQYLYGNRDATILSTGINVNGISGVNVNNITISGLKITGNNTGTTSLDSNGLFFDTCTNIRIENNDFANWGKDSTGYGSAISFDKNCNDLWVDSNRITGGQGGGGSSDINVYSEGGYCFITDNECFSTNSQGIFVNSTAAVNTSGKCVIQGNISKNHSRHGIVTSYNAGGYLDTIVDSNICIDCGWTGIYAATTVSPGGTIVISDNVVNSCGGDLGGSTTSAGILLTANTLNSRTNVTGNYVYNSGKTSAGVARALTSPCIFVSTQGYANITGNICDTSTGEGINIAPTTFENINITGNLIHDCVAGIKGQLAAGQVGGLLNISSNTIKSLLVDGFGIYLLAIGTSIKMLSIQGNLIDGLKLTSGKVGLYIPDTDIKTGNISNNILNNFDTGMKIDSYTTTAQMGRTCLNVNNTISNCTNGLDSLNVSALLGFFTNLVFINNSNNTASTVPAFAVATSPNKVFYASANPSGGTAPWIVGDRAINSVPTVGQPKGWVCTVAGSPGTWVSEGNL
jgi:hypothetical protein